MYTSVCLLIFSWNAAIFWALHGYFIPTKLIVHKTGNKKTSKRYTIRGSQESFIFVGKSLQELEDHLLHIKNIKSSIQPFIYCVTEDIWHINDITVYFDDIGYNFKNFVSSVNICFKIINLIQKIWHQKSISYRTISIMLMLISCIFVLVDLAFCFVCLSFKDTIDIILCVART